MVPGRGDPGVSSRTDPSDAADLDRGGYADLYDRRRGVPPKRRPWRSGSSTSSDIRERFSPDDARFTRPPRNPESAFVSVAGVGLDQVLCHEEAHVVGQDNVVQFEGANLQRGRQAGRRMSWH